MTIGCLLYVILPPVHLPAIYCGTVVTKEILASNLTYMHIMLFLDTGVGYVQPTVTSMMHVGCRWTNIVDRMDSWIELIHLNSLIHVCMLI